MQLVRDHGFNYKPPGISSFPTVGSQRRRTPGKEMAREQREQREDSVWKGQIWSMLPFILRLFSICRLSYNFSYDAFRVAT